MAMTEELKKQARLFVIKWLNEHPIDYEWRKEFNIPFGSPQHQSVDFIDQQIWYEERQLLKDLRENPDAEIDEDGRVIVSDDNEFGMSKEEIEKEFENMNISELNKKHGKRE